MGTFKKIIKIGVIVFVALISIELLLTILLPPLEEKPSNNIPKIGESVTVGDLEVTVLEKKSFEYSDEANALLLTIKVRNLGKEPVTVHNSKFQLVDAQVREYSYDRGLATQLLEDSFFLKKIQPGLSFTGIVPFVYPKDATELKLKVRSGFSEVRYILLEE